ncbi:GSCFA domain-containing protein [Rhizobium binxianense]
MTNPYAAIEDFQLWRRSVSRVETHLFDPVVEPKFHLSRTSKIATAGSCFAQHISRQLQRIGFHYFVPESGRGLTESEQVRRNFGVFSARYGNLYTARQLLQLFEEAFEGREPVEKAWPRKDGRYVDPYRPQIEPDGFESEEAVIKSRRQHLAAVRSVFADADVLVFTLGLTEAWRSREDGSVFPLAPGVVAGSFDPKRHEFVNFKVAEVDCDLVTFLGKLRQRNPSIKVLLTVSPRRWSPPTSPATCWSRRPTASRSCGWLPIRSSPASNGSTISPPTRSSRAAMPAGFITRTIIAR